MIVKNQLSELIIDGFFKNIKIFKTLLCIEHLNVRILLRILAIKTVKKSIRQIFLKMHRNIPLNLAQNRIFEKCVVAYKFIESLFHPHHRSTLYVLSTFHFIMAFFNK